MKKVIIGNSSEPPKRIRPALTPDARENQLVSLAIDLVERRLIEGTASSQETTHFLKIGSSTSKIEKRILEKQEALLEAKTKAMQSTERVEELYDEAIKAMRNYSGQGGADD